MLFRLQRSAGVGVFDLHGQRVNARDQESSSALTPQQPSGPVRERVWPYPPPGAYPAGDAVDVALRDGKSIHIRPVQEVDRTAIRGFFERLSTDSLWFRFLGLPSLDWVTDWSVDVDYADRYALVATAAQSSRSWRTAPTSGSTPTGPRSRSSSQTPGNSTASPRSCLRI